MSWDAIVLGAFAMLVICWQQYVIFKVGEAFRDERDKLKAYLAMSGTPPILDANQIQAITLGKGDTAMIDMRMYKPDHLSLTTDATCRLTVAL